MNVIIYSEISFKVANAAVYKSPSIAQHFKTVQSKGKITKYDTKSIMYLPLIYLSICVLCAYGKYNFEFRPNVHSKLNSLGVADVNGRQEGLIIGGTPARIEDFNWQILMIVNNVPKCGGSIVTARKIVTAAHCTFNINNINQLRLRAGSSRHDAGGVLVTAVKIFEHPNFNRPTSLNNDIAVILLRDALPIGSPTIGAISIGNGRPPTGTVVTVSGYGATQIGVDRPSVLHSASVPVVDPKVCTKN